MSINIIIKRLLGTVHRNDISQVFIREDVQSMLKDITRFNEKKIFRRRQLPRLKSPKMLFMTDQQLKHAKEMAYDHAKARLQMPPVMAPNDSEPAILAQDKEIAGYTKFRCMFIDISPGISDRNRLMSVREIDGTLREPTYEERTRLNHMFYPGKGRSIDVPKLFEEKNLLDLMKRKEYEFALNCACNQFEPDDPRYVKATSFIYDCIDEKGDHDMLRSTRHFGPMSLYLAYNKRADYLILEMLSKNLIEDAVKLVKIYHTCHNIEYGEDSDEDHLGILKNYAENHSAKKYNLDLALQKLSNQD